MPCPVSVTKSSTAAGPGVEPRADREAPRRAAAHGPLGVQDEVEQRLLQLAAVGDDGRQPGLELGHELDAAQPELVGPQRQHALHELGRRPAARAPRSAAGRTPAGCARCSPRAPTPRRCGADPAPTSAAGRAGVARPQLALEQLREADDARQRVVQLVRDAGDELTDRRELLGLEQLRLRRLEPIDRRGQLGVGLPQLVAHVPQPPRRANLFRDVLRDLHDRRAGRAGVDGRERRDAEDLLVGEGDLGALGARERAFRGRRRRVRARAPSCARARPMAHAGQPPPQSPTSPQVTPRIAVTGRLRSAASAVLPRSSRPWRSKTAIGSLIASKVRSHSCLPRRTESCSRAFWTATTICPAMIASSRSSATSNRDGLDAPTLSTPSSSSPASSGRLMPLRIMNSARLAAETPGARSSTTHRPCAWQSPARSATTPRRSRTRCTRDGPTDAVIS